MPPAVSPLPCLAHVEISSFPPLIQARLSNSCLFVSQAQNPKPTEFVLTNTTLSQPQALSGPRNKEKGPARKRLSAKNHSKRAGSRWRLSSRQVLLPIYCILLDKINPKGDTREALRTVVLSHAKSSEIKEHARHFSQRRRLPPTLSKPEPDLGSAQG